MKFFNAVLLTILIPLLSSCRPGNDGDHKLSFPLLSASQQNQTEQTPTDDVSEIRHMLSEILEAYDTEDQSNNGEIPGRYFDKNKIEEVYGNVGPVRNKLTIDDTVIYSETVDLRENRFTLRDHTIDLNFDKARITGFVDGTAVVPGQGVLRGPWKMTAGAFKHSGKWYIAYFRLVYFHVMNLEYHLQLPDKYGKDKDKKWPLIVFLHGAGERGGSLDQLKRMNHSIPKIAATRRNFPFVAVSPLCPSPFSWYEISFSVDRLISEISGKYNIDTDRIYLTGLSLGGIGTWEIAAQFPDRFAAIAPVCGSVDPAKADRLKDVPIWAFHGADDTIVPMDSELITVNRLKSLKSDIKYTVYPNVGHNAWEKAYAGSKLYRWFLGHSLKKRGKQ